MTVCNAVPGKFIIASLLRARRDSDAGEGSTGQVGNSERFSGNLLLKSKAIFSPSDPAPLVKH